MQHSLRHGTLQNLPEDILRIIAESLDTPSLKAFRLTCRHFGLLGAHNLITKITIEHTDESLQTFREIIRHPILSKTVTRLNYRPQIRTPHDRSTFFEAVERKSFGYIRPKDIAAGAAWYIHNSRSDAQREIHRTDLDRLVIREAFRTLPRLSEVTVGVDDDQRDEYDLEGGEVLSIYRRPRLGRHRHDFSDGSSHTFECKYDDYVLDRPWATILDALALRSALHCASSSSLSAIRYLDLGRVNPRSLSSVISGWAPESNHSDSERHLESFRMLIFYFQYYDRDRAAISHLSSCSATLLSSSCLLKEVALEGYDRDGGHRYQPSLESSTDLSLPYQFRLEWESCVRANTWPQLASLRLVQVHIDQQHFVAFLDRHRTLLKSLHIKDASLSKHSWKRFLNSIRDLDIG